MTAIVQPSDPTEDAKFDEWDARISTPPTGSSEDQEAAAAADWILKTYLTNPSFPKRQVYLKKVEPWASSHKALFGKLGTAIGSHARSGADLECVGYWDDSGSTMAWDMKAGSGFGRFLFGGLVDTSLNVTQVGLFDVTDVTLHENPTTALLETNTRWAMFGASPAYAPVRQAVNAIENGTYAWPNN
jgi:hypothetical protein